MSTKLYTSLFMCLALAGAPACSKKPEAVKLAGDDKVLARVNGSAITQYDLDQAVERFVGADQAPMLDEAARKNILDSLVHSRAIAQASEKELSAEERAELERAVAAEREELLIKRYLGKHTRPSPVSSDHVQKYYDQNKERFGAGKLRTYELLTLTTTANAAERTRALGKLDAAAAQKDWPAWTEAQKKAGEPIALRRGQDDEAMLHPKLKQLVGQLAVGEASKITFVDGAPYVVRVTAVREIPAKPLAEVRGEILKTLEPMRLREAVKQASDRVVKKAEVAYR